ncbi:DNA-protecting protein DprA [Saccharopolyspora sp. HNM0983]|uniref:DNA-protecting protein DprA n=1 Tax=Saccharopolyspora montiporae TaxID=2781240 RepID=A0A929B6Z5_9PSEU|nr:DNA-processing protein DprA [Saccharopolyspora sp. HNM0983]MBE9374372.1 DNA-protecting protein DprA [Saccharopolyspora sp. HNM0983]
MSASEQVLVDRAYLSAVAEPPAVRLAGFVAEKGAVAAAEAVRSAREPAEVADEVAARRRHVDGALLLDQAARSGARLVVPESAEWPAAPMAALAGAREVGLPGVAEPLALWVRAGAVAPALTEPGVAVVGARAASGYGEHVAAEFGHGLAAAGFPVVSGAAYGIDGAAHRGALAAERTTVAVLACGVDVDYPAGHARLLRVIGQCGAVLSEYPPGTRPRKHRFLVRNRLIAALGTATVVVEAGARSGAANTAHTADLLGRHVLAVPGPVTAVNSVGCHELIRSGGAVLATGVPDVLEALGRLGVSPPAAAESAERRGDALRPEVRRLHDALPVSGAAPAEELARDSGLPLHKVRALLPELELDGAAVRCEGGWSAM